MHFALLLWLTTAAHADAVAPPDCPDGTRGVFGGHALGGCEPWPCDAACPEGSCRTIGVCYVDVRDPEGPEPLRLAVGNCDEPGICLPDRALFGDPVGDGHCEIAERCVVAEATRAPSAPRVGPPCGCGARRDAPGALVALGVVVVGVAGRDVRRRRRSRAAPR